MSDKQDIVAQLRSWSGQLKSLSRWTSGKLKFPQRITLIGEAADEIERLRQERDEARRSCCEFAAIVDGADTTEGMESGRFYEIAMKYMKSRGWDCFKEEDNA